ncbi:Lactation elevated protein 1 [Globisporangium polare]
MLTKMRLASVRIRALRSTAALGLRARNTSSSSAAVTSGLSDVQPPSRVYSARVAHGALTHDRAQALVLSKHLDKLHKQLDGYSLPVLSAEPSSSSASDTEATADANVEAQDEFGIKESSVKAEPPVRVLVPRGLYLHGSVGTGKSMLMDLFFANVPTQQKRRVHFNKFMLEVHERIQKHKQAQLATFGRQRNIDLDPSRDVITIVAEQIASESHVLCFDEFQVTDIADALIMRKLFGVFFSRGVVMVATSNTPPQSLYRDGTNREYFLPFLDQLARHARVVAIKSETDYRMLSESFGESMFLFPLTTENNGKLDTMYKELVGGDDEELSVPVMMGRTLQVRGSRNGVCRATFDLLCNTEKGAADYKALCECFISFPPSLCCLCVACTAIGS